MTIIRRVLELARWAPSGDNTQPWRFEITSDSTALVHAFDTREHCVYDLDGYASRLSHGALLETIALASTRFGCRSIDAVVDEDTHGNVTYAVRLEETTPRLDEDPLVPFIEQRSVQRRPMRMTPLTAAQKDALQRAVAGFRVLWFEAPAKRRQIALLNARNAHIRLTIPEAYEVHKAVIQWHAHTSVDRLPDASLGADPLLLATMRFAMGSWRRIDLMNRFAGGTLLPRLMLDFLPGVMCSAHFALIAQATPRASADFVSAGRAVQRLWLTATRYGLQMQPSYTPLVFARYAREGRQFTTSPRAITEAASIAQRLDDALGPSNAENAVFLGRLGPATGQTEPARSIRLPLDRLLVEGRPRNAA
jgi:nitroreductase